MLVEWGEFEKQLSPLCYCIFHQRTKRISHDFTLCMRSFPCTAKRSKLTAVLLTFSISCLFSIEEVVSNAISIVIFFFNQLLMVQDK